MRRALTALAVLAAAGSVHVPTVPAASGARVGAFYFDGWAGPLSNFHFVGLLDGAFTGREPLYGWRDDTLDSMRTQLAWAHQVGIRFFLFDWYYSPAAGNGPLNSAHDNYLRLRNHDGVRYALMYVNQEGFVIPPDYWRRWPTTGAPTTSADTTRCESTANCCSSSSTSASSRCRWAVLPE